VPEWMRWSPILLRPGLYGTRPAEGGNKFAKVRPIREALCAAKRVWLATDCNSSVRKFSAADTNGPEEIDGLRHPAPFAALRPSRCVYR
jgi:hypothetical protein